MQRELLTPQDVADMLGVSKVTVLRLLREGRLPYQRIGYRIRWWVAVLDNSGTDSSYHLLVQMAALPEGAKLIGAIP